MAVTELGDVVERVLQVASIAADLALKLMLKQVQVEVVAVEGRS